MCMCVLVCARILPQDVLYVIGIKNVVVVRHVNTPNLSEIAAYCLIS